MSRKTPPRAARRQPGKTRASARAAEAPSPGDPSPRAGALGSPFTIYDLGAAGDAGAQAHYADPRYYSHAYDARRHDVEYYVRKARSSGGPVLEYGVGNGRVALPIARAKVAVTGVDLSRPMLDDLRERLAREPPALRARVTLHHGDMRHVRLNRRFALVLAPFNAVLHLYTRSDLEAFLAGVREHLAPGARFLFDFSVPAPQDLARDPERAYAAPDLVDFETGEEVHYCERFEYDPLRQLLLVRTEFSPERTAPFTVPLTHRQYFPREMEALLHYNGFEEILFTADFTDQAADRSVDSIVVSCRARA